MEEVWIVLNQIWENNASEIAVIALTLLGISEKLPFMKKIKANGIVELAISLVVSFFKKKAQKQ